ncbi:hypothetical protein DFH09DRAFT_921392 [Mycena vulgaris]|nr:hypothetical protein DFH09DRAFT_921392 [Mycena vulgaris]
MDVEESVTRASLDAGEANNNQHRDGDDDVDGLVDLTALLSGDNLRRLKAGALPVRKVLIKASPYLQSSLSAALSALQLRRIAYTIVNSTTLVKPRWEAILQEVNLSQRLMPRDVSTRWNSMYDMLVFALQYRKAVDSLTGDRKLDLRIYEMDDAEWLVAQQLADVLEYYDKTDHSETYRIAMILRPKHKLAYFRKAGWEDAWIRSAEQLLRAEFLRSYAQLTHFELGTRTSSRKSPGKKVFSSVCNSNCAVQTYSQKSTNILTIWTSHLAMPTMR